MINNLNEAIAYERKEAEVFTETSNALYRDFYQISLNCQERADYHEKLASWLTELQERREAVKKLEKEIEHFKDCLFGDGMRYALKVIGEPRKCARESEDK